MRAARRLSRAPICGKVFLMTAVIESKSSAIDAIACFRDGFAAIKPHYATFLAMILIQFIVSALANFVPFIGTVLGSAVSATLICGIFIALLSTFRGQAPAITKMFEGFSRFLPCVVFMLIQTIPFVIVAFVLIQSGTLPESFTSGTDQNLTPEQITEIITAIGAPLIGAYAAAFVVSLGIKALLYFAVPLVAEHNLGAGSAIALSIEAFRKNAGGVLLVILLQTLLMIAGALLFLIGMFFLAPIFYAAEAMAYRQVFANDLEEIEADGAFGRTE